MQLYFVLVVVSTFGLVSTDMLSEDSYYNYSSSHILFIAPVIIVALSVFFCCFGAVLCAICCTGCCRKGTPGYVIAMPSSGVTVLPPPYPVNVSTYPAQPGIAHNLPYPQIDGEMPPVPANCGPSGPPPAYADIAGDQERKF